MYGAPAPAATPGLQDQGRLILLEGGRPPVRHYAGLEGVIKPALALLPEGKHDDQVDSTAQFLEELYRKALNSTASRLQ